MRILYITEQVHLHGGAEKILIQKLNYWADVYNYEVMLITSEQHGKPVCYPMSKKVRHVDLDVGYISGKSYFGPSNITKFPKHYTALKTEIDIFKPDAIFLISLTWIRFALPYIAKGYKIYNEYHTSYYGFQLGYDKASAFTKLKKSIARYIINYVENQYTSIVFLNQAEYDYYNRKNGVIIPNFFEADVNISKIQKKNRIISLGRMYYQKGYDLLIDAWSLIDDKIEGWTVEIFGEGEDKEMLRRKALERNFKNSLNFNDGTSEVSEELLQSQFYVLSSRTDTFPMVLLEALSHGLGVVSFDCPSGPRSILTEGSDGFLAKQNDVQDLAEKILLLIQSEELRTDMGCEAMINVQRFRPEKVMLMWQKLITFNK